MANWDHIFTRFQNLNLINLIHGLEAGDVIAGGFFTGVKTGKMCPMAHGFDGVDEKTWEVQLGLSEEQMFEFTRWWDVDAAGKLGSHIVNEKNRYNLMHQLEDIWQQRLEDADAVQEVCSPQEGPEFKELRKQRLYYEALVDHNREQCECV